jgi:hypothetical protein
VEELQIAPLFPVLAVQTRQDAGLMLSNIAKMGTASKSHGADTTDERICYRCRRPAKDLDCVVMHKTNKVTGSHTTEKDR